MKMELEKHNGEWLLYDDAGVAHPTWIHEDGTIVSHWDNLPQLLICDDEVRYITHEEADLFGYYTE